MTIVGNIFLFLSAVFYLGLFSMNASRPNLAGENAMGYGLGLFFLGIGFIICSLVLTASVVMKGGFEWVSPNAGTRYLLVWVGWIMVAVTIFFSAAFKWEKAGIPPEMLWPAGHCAVWMPILLLGASAILLNDGLRSAAPAWMYKVPMTILFTVGAAASLSLLIGWIRMSAQEQQEQIEQEQQQNDELHAQYLKDIEACKPNEGEILNILALTGRFHDEDVRTAAVAKIKTNPAWEQELLRLLDTDWYYQVYTFIDGNAVDHPELFAAPLNRSMLHLAEDMRNDIRDANNLQGWHMDHYGIERLLRVLDDFEGHGVDFRPAVRAMRDALDQEPPAHLKKIRFDVTPVLDSWIRQHP